MPELPEVQTVVDTLSHLIESKEIKTVELRWEKILANARVDEFSKRLQRQKFLAFSRRGKYLLFELNQDMLIVHLRMEGKFFYYPKPTVPDKHTHVVFIFTDNSELHYHDVRKFGKMYLYHKDEPYKALDSLGKEPWDENLTVQYLRNCIGKRKISVKQLLLEQGIIAGIGNIYASEILFEAHIHPETTVNKLTDADLANIITYTRKVLKEAIAAGGTTVRSYTSSLGVSGRFQLSLFVYDREGKSCKRCHTPIIRITQNGRSSFFCPNCQQVKV